jgi:hypothetical protein
VLNYYLITGSSWKPIGKRERDTKKRTSWFTDIPYLRNPFLSYPRLHSGPGNIPVSEFLTPLPPPTYPPQLHSGPGNIPVSEFLTPLLPPTYMYLP